MLSVTDCTKKADNLADVDLIRNTRQGQKVNTVKGMKEVEITIKMRMKRGFRAISLRLKLADIKRKR